MTDVVPNIISQMEQKTCFHGKNLRPCNRNVKLNFCRYWHFYPTERKQDLIEKYEEIMENFKQAWNVDLKCGGGHT